jgi:hypothetical protein
MEQQISFILIYLNFIFFNLRSICMSHELLKQMKKKDLLMRTMFANTVCTEGFLTSVMNNPKLFNETLAFSKDQNWITPKQLSEKLSDYSEQHIRRWFDSVTEKSPTPKGSVMKEVLLLIAKLIQDSTSKTTDKVKLAIAS